MDFQQFEKMVMQIAENFSLKVKVTNLKTETKTQIETPPVVPRHKIDDRLTTLFGTDVQKSTSRVVTTKTTENTVDISDLRKLAESAMNDSA
jgi:hypothetical protein